MKDAAKVKRSYDKALDALLSRMPTERRLKGITPEQRLEGLSPVQIARALRNRFTEAEHVLALPNPILRALSEEYVATLPDDVRAKVRARRR